MSDSIPQTFPLGVTSEGSISFYNDGLLASVCNDSLMKIFNIKEQSIESFDIEKGIRAVASTWKSLKKNVLFYGGDNQIVWSVTNSKFTSPYKFYES
jgi:hypothetical protein